MKTIRAGVALAVLLLVGGPWSPFSSVEASSSKGSKSTGRSRSRASHTVATGRSANGRIARSEEVKRQFMRQTGFPKGRPGYVVDHVRPLACGGADAPSNMQWQTVAAAKAKDKVERVGCK